MNKISNQQETACSVYVCLFVWPPPNFTPNPLPNSRLSVVYVLFMDLFHLDHKSRVCCLCVCVCVHTHLARHQRKTRFCTSTHERKLHSSFITELILLCSLTSPDSAVILSGVISSTSMERCL